MAIYIEESISHGTRCSVFQPNDEALFALLRLEVTRFMHGLFLHGAFRGRTPRSVYFVRCGRETTNQRDFDSKVVNVVVGFALRRPKKFETVTVGLRVGRKK